jgi:hypothetical protein
MWLGPLWLAVAACGDGAVETRSATADITRDAVQTAPDGDIVVPEGDGASDVAETLDDVLADTADPVDAVDTMTDGGDGDVALDVDDDLAGPSCPFEPFDEGLAGGRVERIQFDPRVPGLAWVTSADGLMRSNDAGLSFEPRASEYGATVLAFPAGDAKSLLAISNAGLAASNDAGLTLEPRALGGLRLTAIAASPAQATRVWVGTDGGGILRSDNGGDSFVTANVGVPYGQVMSLAASPATADVALAGVTLRNEANLIQNRGVLLRTANAGRSWTVVSEDVAWGHQLVWCPSDPNRVHAAVRSGILESRDGGLTWKRLPLLATRDVLDVAYGAGGCDTLWVLVYQDGIYRLDLNLMAQTGPIRRGIATELSRFQGWLAPHPLDPLVILVATNSGIKRSTDGGYTYHSVVGPSTLVMTSLEGTLDGSGLLLLGTSGNGLLQRTRDTAWHPVESLARDVISHVHTNPFDSNHLAMYTTASSFIGDAGVESLRPLPAAVNNLIHILWRDGVGDLLVATQTQGVQRSIDGGRTFTAWNQGLTAWPTPNGTFIDVRWLLVDRNDERRVLAGLRGRGLARREPDADWTLIDNTLANDEVLMLVRAGDILYALVSGKGIQQSLDDGATWRDLNDGLENANLADLAHDPIADRLFVTGGAPNAVHMLEGASTLVASRARWRPIGRGCFDARSSPSRLTLVTRPDGGNDLVIGASRNRIWRVDAALDMRP